MGDGTQIILGPKATIVDYESYDDEVIINAECKLSNFAEHRVCNTSFVGPKNGLNFRGSFLDEVKFSNTVSAASFWDARIESIVVNPYVRFVGCDFTDAILDEAYFHYENSDNHPSVTMFVGCPGIVPVVIDDWQFAVVGGVFKQFHNGMFHDPIVEIEKGISTGIIALAKARRKNMGSWKHAK